MMLKRRLALLLLFTTVGLLAELLLTKHWDGFWQVVPLPLLVLGVAVATVPLPARVVQAVMALGILSGVVGTVLHTRGKMEFALERNPALTGMALIRETLKGTSPPILAPGAMIAIGLLGLLTLSKPDRPTVRPSDRRT